MNNGNTVNSGNNDNNRDKQQTNNGTMPLNNGADKQ